MIEALLKQGLSSAAVRQSRAQYGSNILIQQESHSWNRLLLAQFASPLMYILLLAAVVSLFLREFVDALVIAAAAFLNVLLGFIQEYKAEAALQALARVLAETCVVMRDGKRAVIDTTSLVPGDLVFLEAGDKVPADGVLLSAQEVRINEAILTGESIPVLKSAVSQSGLDTNTSDFFAWIQSKFELPQQHASKPDAAVYSGTTLEKGNAAFLVTAIGNKTQIGQVAASLSKLQPEPTPLQQRLSRLSKKLAGIVVALAFGVFVLGVIAGQEATHMFSLAVALGVSAIPEGLVISLTALLAVAMQRLLKRKALVRKMMAAEVLGSVDVICTDKTGTLTHGVFRVKEIVADDLKLSLELAHTAMDLTDPMEVTLYEYAAKKTVGMNIKKHARLDRKPFDSKTKVSLTLTDKELFVYGAPEAVIESSQATRSQKLVWLENVESFAKKGYRVTAMAHRKNMGSKKITQKIIHDPWHYLGLVVYEDTLRESVKQALKQAKQAGIELKIITGDHLATAQSVLQEAGVQVPLEATIDGATLGQLSVEALRETIHTLTLFYRTSPDQKLAIVTALKQTGHVVAMTGDGVNDALALKKADIGIVMDNASSVSKETADMVLLDSDFGTIVAAVEEGRSAVDNLKKILLYLLSDSFTEIIIVLGALALGMVIPITPLQILWVNLINDGPPNLALTLEPKTKGLLKQKPNPPSGPLITPSMRTLIAVISVVTAGMILLIYSRLLAWGYSVMHAQTMAFTMLGLDSLLYVFSCRSHESLWRSRPFENLWLVGAVLLGLGSQLLAIYHPFFQNILGTMGLNQFDWGIIALSSSLVVICIEIFKFFLRNWVNRKAIN